MKMTTSKWLVIIFLIAIKFTIQIIAIDPVYELHRDEYLHLDLGHHLAWGYTSVPPITGLISYIVHLFGAPVFWVKFFPALFGALTIWIVCRLIDELGGGLFAVALGGVGVLLSVYVRINILYQPNSLDFLAWTLFFYFIVRYLKEQQSIYLYWAAITLAIGFLNKYNIIFSAIGLLLAFLLSAMRTIFRDKHLYFALGIALLIVLPNLIWQYSHDFPVIKHMTDLSSTQLVNIQPLEFLNSQWLPFLGALPVIVAALLAFWRYDEFKSYRVFFWSFMITLLIFALLRAKDYYAFGLYPIYIAFGSVYLDAILSTGWKRYVRPALLLWPIIVFVGMYRLMLPVLTPEEIIADKETFNAFELTRWEDGQLHHIPQDYADMLGWKELAELTTKAWHLSPESEHTIIHCDNYGQAGAINYYASTLPTEALSMNADYILWYPLEEKDIRHVILVQENTDDDPERTREREFFDEVTLIGEVTNPYAREKGAKVYLLQGAKISINTILQEEIDNRQTL